MAAVVRGGHARHGQGGGRGRRARAGGRGHGGAAAAPEPAQVLNPIGFQWNFWKEGNSNTKRKTNKELELEVRIYMKLENHPRINQDELHSYGISAGLLHQDENIVRMLNGVVSIYNRMAGKRRRYLSKKLHGACGKEMSLMLKSIQSDTELAESLVDDIRSAGGFCPPTPTVLSDLPHLK